MKITRFLRRYSKILLMVFMSLLLVVFLIGDVLQSWTDSRTNPNQALGKAFGQPFTTNDLQRMQGDANILREVGVGIPATLDILDLYLLEAEARELRVRVARDDVVNALGSSGMSGEVLAKVRDQHGRSTDSIYEVIGNWMAVNRVFALQAAALVPSQPRLELSYRDQMQEAEVKLSVIESEALVSTVPPPTEAELQAFFEEARDRETAHTEDQLEFGYKLPDRVQIEYLTVDPNKLEAAVRVSEREAKRFYEDNQAQYYRNVPRTDTTTQPGARPEFERVPLSYEEARERVRNDCRSAKAIEAAQRLMNELREEALRPWLGAETSADQFRPPPAAEQIVSFEQLREKLSTEYEVEYYRTEIVDQQKLRSEPGIGRASVQVGTGQQRVTAPALAFRVKGLYTPQRNEAAPVLNLLEPSPTVFEYARVPGYAGTRPRQAFVFRVLQVVPSGPPAAVDEVREKLTEDLRLVKAHELAGEYARKLAERAREAGLDEAVAQAEELKGLLSSAEAAQVGPPEAGTVTTVQYMKNLGPITPSGRFTRSAASISAVGSTENLRKAVFALAEQPESAAAAPHRVAVVAVASRHKWVVAEVLQAKPLYAGPYAQLRGVFAAQSARDSQTAFAKAWFDPANIRARTKYEPATRALPVPAEDAGE